MKESPISVQLISDFNIKLLAQYLVALGDSGSYDVQTTPFGQVYQSLMSSPKMDEIGVVWTFPESVIPSFARAAQLREVDHQVCIQETREFARAVIKFSEGRRHVFVASWFLKPGFRGYGILDWKPGIGLSNLIACMNSCLAEELSEASNIYLLDSTRWLDSVQCAMSPKMWYATKTPFVNKVFENAARNCIAGFKAVSGWSRKLVIVDLDNTLWGGVIGETGWQGILSFG